MATSQKGVGIPVKLLHEAEGHVVTVELMTGEMYRGELFEAEDNMNVQLKDETATGRDGRVSQLAHIFIRGSRVRFFIIPDMLKNAPMFKRIDPKFKNKNMALGVGGRGRAAAGRRGASPPAAHGARPAAHDVEPTARGGLRCPSPRPRSNGNDACANCTAWDSVADASSPTGP